MSTEITLLYSGVIVSEESSESVQWPKCWYIYMYLYIYIYIYIYIIIYYTRIYRHIYFVGEQT